IKRLGLPCSSTGVAIQGFGNVGSHAAKFLHDAQFPIVAVSDISGTYFNRDGLNIPELLRHKFAHPKGLLEGFQHADVLPLDALLTLDEVDVLIPAALGGVITESNVDDIHAKVIIEAANGPIYPAADKILFDRGVTVVPDILANAGGVTVSYFEWVQNRQHYRWPLDRVRQELDHTMNEAFEGVWQMSAQHQVSLRTAAFMIGIQRVQRAAALAGLI
ncbi:MAG: glutamate dehydrogenase, partial [Planctomycetota bacterium]